MRKKSIGWFLKILIINIVFICLFIPVNAVPDPNDYNITLVHPLNQTSCYVPHLSDEGEPSIDFSYIPYSAFDYCQLYTNKSGVFSLELIDYSIVEKEINEFDYSIDDIPVSLLWGIKCSNPGIHWSLNYTLFVTDAPYCAVLSDTVCPSVVPVYSDAVFKTRLSNTNGIYLENQDCNVWIEKDGVIVKSFDTLMNQQDTDLQIDENGNWINVGNKKVPLTDALGYYVYSFAVDDDWAWVGDTYSVVAVCNGQQTSCDFNVTSQRLPDMENVEQFGKKASGFIVLILFVVVVVGGVVLKAVRR